MKKTPQKTNAFEALAKEAGIPSANDLSSSPPSAGISDSTDQILNEDILGISEESKYPKSKGRQRSAAKKRTTRVVKPDEETASPPKTITGASPSAKSNGKVTTTPPAKSGGKAATSRGKAVIDKSTTSETPTADGKRMRILQPALPEIFRRIAFNDTNGSYQNPIYRMVTPYGLWALYDHAGRDSSDEGRDARSELEYRNYSIEQVEKACANIPKVLIDAVGSDAKERCAKERCATEAKPLDQMVAYAATVSEKPKVPSTEIRPSLKTLVAEHTEHPEYSGVSESSAASNGIFDSVTSSTSAIVEFTSTIEEPTTEEPTVTEPTIEEPTIEERMTAEAAPEVKNIDEYNLNIVDVLNSIEDLEGYAKFIDVVKTIPVWTNLKGIQLYYLMMPVELRIWKAVNKIPPVQAILHDSYELRNDKSFQDCEFGNMTCIYHKMILKWAADNGVFASNPEFIQRRHDIFKVYNSFIVEHLE